MSERFIVMSGPELRWNGAPEDYFWLYSIEHKKALFPAFSTEDLAIAYAKRKGFEIVDQWDEDDWVAIDEVIEVVPKGDMRIVLMTAYRKGSIAPSTAQPKHRYWIFAYDGRLLATRASPLEAFQLIGALASLLNSEAQQAPRDVEAHDRAGSQP